MPPIKTRVYKNSAYPWIVSRLAGFKKLVADIQDSPSSQIIDGVFTTTEQRLIEETIEGVIQRVRKQQYDRNQGSGAVPLPEHNLKGSTIKE